MSSEFYRPLGSPSPGVTFEVTVAQAAATVEREAARQEQSKCEALAAEAQRMKTEADNELQEALPAMEKAKAAVDCLDKASITELKTFGKPAQECIDVVAACGFLLKHVPASRKLFFTSSTVETT
eukprot:g14990.t1